LSCDRSKTYRKINLMTMSVNQGPGFQYKPEGLDHWAPLVLTEAEGLC